MSKYKRLTENEFDCSRCKDRKCTIPDAYCCDRLRCEIYNRLAELEDKIENGDLISISDIRGNKIEFFAKHDTDIRKETAEKIYLQAKEIVDATKHIVQGIEYIHIDALKEIIKNCVVE